MASFDLKMMLRYLFLDIISSKKQTIFQVQSSRNLTVKEFNC